MIITFMCVVLHQKLLVRDEGRHLWVGLARVGATLEVGAHLFPIRLYQLFIVGALFTVSKLDSLQPRSRSLLGVVHHFLVLKPERRVCWGGHAEVAEWSGDNRQDPPPREAVPPIP